MLEERHPDVKGVFVADGQVESGFLVKEKLLHQVDLASPSQGIPRMTVRPLCEGLRRSGCGLCAVHLGNIVKPPV
ncbi:hypothetical protein DMENIID0001_127940 [Sergentomyia squamirostris]